MESNYNIENFFKNRLERQHFPFKEEDWQALETRLDNVRLHTVSSIMYISLRKLTIILLVAISMSFFLGWMVRDKIFHQNPDIREGYVHQEIIPVETGISHNKPMERSGGFTKNRESGNIVNHLIPEKDKSISSSLPEDRTTNELIKSNQQTQPRQQQVGFPSTTLHEKTPETRNPSNQGIPDNDISILAIREPSIETLYNQTSIHNFKAKPDLANELESKIKPVTLNNFFDRLSIGVVLGPELSSVGQSQGGPFSFLIGGQIWYRFSSNWTLGSGVLYSNKKYNTDAAGYSPPQGYWIARTNGVLPDKIKGSCRVLDFPLNLSFNKRFLSDYAFLVSAGISSYLLLDEYYDFKFDSGNPGAETGWHTTNNSLVTWGAVNTAIGFGYRVNQQLSILVGYNIKIPIKEVGWGNVMLNSSGFNVTVAHNFLK